MRAFFDTEYLIRKARKNGRRRRRPILVSIGIIRDDGAELHLVSSEFEIKPEEWWFKKNVFKPIQHEPRLPVAEIGRQVTDFLAGVSQIVTREGGLDREMLESLVGPLGMDFFDIEMAWQMLCKPQLSKRDRKPHHALDDARWHRTLFYEIAA